VAPFRFDRLLTLYFFRPIQKLFGNREPHVSVLMYHSISEPIASRRHPYYETRTSPVIFREQMRFLHDDGVTTLFPNEIFPWLARADASSNAVCLTFDDAYEDFLTAAFPVVREFGLKSTVYVPTGLVSGTGPNGLKILSWSQIQYLSKEGVHFGSHTVSHPNMARLSETELIWELEQSKKSLTDVLGKKIEDFSHPFAFPEKNKAYIDFYSKTLCSVGYRTGMTTIIGSTEIINNALMICRLPANNYDDSSFFYAKLNLSYDWVHHLQASTKAIREFLHIR
jgi:peptidoglycan/xylan/chitin deacetylase (PgdA/CDA1 family)